MGERLSVSLPDAIFLRERRDLIDELKTPDFDMFSVSEDQLLCSIEDMFLHVCFQTLGFIFCNCPANQMCSLDVLKLESQKLRNFILAVHKRSPSLVAIALPQFYLFFSSYRGNPFHNFLHAFSVTQMMFFFLAGANVRSRIQEMDAVLLMVAALCHDLDHPGLNNVFQIKSKSNLAFIYQVISSFVFCRLSLTSGVSGGERIGGLSCRLRLLPAQQP